MGRPSWKANYLIEWFSGLQEIKEKKHLINDQYMLILIIILDASATSITLLGKEMVVNKIFIQSKIEKRYYYT